MPESLINTPPPPPPPPHTHTHTHTHPPPTTHHPPHTPTPTPVAGALFSKWSCIVTSFINDRYYNPSFHYKYRVTICLFKTTRRELQIAQCISRIFLLLHVWCVVVYNWNFGPINFALVMARLRNKVTPVWGDFMFSVRFRRRVRVRRRRRNDFCFSRQNHLSFTLDIWDKESIGLEKCTGWPFGDLDPRSRLWHW